MGRLPTLVQPVRQVLGQSALFHLALSSFDVVLHPEVGHRAANGIVHGIARPGIAVSWLSNTPGLTMSLSLPSGTGSSSRNSRNFGPSCPVTQRNGTCEWPTKHLVVVKCWKLTAATGTETTYSHTGSLGLPWTIVKSSTSILSGKLANQSASSVDICSAVHRAAAAA